MTASSRARRREPGAAGLPGGASDVVGGPLLGAVLAGGRSRRFGRDKTAVAVEGVPMIERAVAALESVCAEVIVVSSRADTPGGRWRVVPDLRSDGGPLAGIEAALVEAEAREGGGWPVLVLAADLPLVDAEAVRELVEAFRSASPGVDAVAASREGEPPFEPLFAVYRALCLPTATRLLDQGRAAAQGLFDAVDGRVVAVAGGAASVNVNTEEDLAAAEARLTGPEETS